MDAYHLSSILSDLASLTPENASPPTARSDNNKQPLVSKKWNKIPADEMWIQLLEYFNDTIKKQNSTDAQKSSWRRERGIVVEVGVHRPRQCIMAARLGYEVHCIEPSPASFFKCKSKVRQFRKQLRPSDDAIVGPIVLHHRAASNTSEATVDFAGDGTTGDHVVLSSSSSITADNNSRIVQKVQTIRIDDIVNQYGHIYSLKVDTQGYEPVVFQGAAQSLQNHQIDYILTEFWPRGMDALLSSSSSSSCTSGAEMLSLLSRANYSIHMLRMVAHPKTNPNYTLAVSSNPPPMDNFRAFCQWFHDLERRLNGMTHYGIGFWTDIVAISPRVTTNFSPRPGLLHRRWRNRLAAVNKNG